MPTRQRITGKRRESGYKSPRLPIAQFPTNLRARMERWQMPGAKRGTQWPGKLAVDEFSYSTGFVTLPGVAGANITVLMKMDTDTFFEVAKRQIFAHSDNYPDGKAPLIVTMFDASSGRELITPTPSSCFGGDGGLPLTLGQIKNLSPTQMVGFRFEQAAPSALLAATLIQVTLTGRKVFINEY